MLSTKATLGLILIGGFLLLFSCQEKKGNCSFDNLKTIFYDVDKKEYIHYVLLETFDRTCLDSSEIVSIAQNYADSVKYGRPVVMIRFFNSDENFIEGETSQLITEIDKDCLVTITLDTALKPVNFLFYDEDGNWIYDGPIWNY